MKFKLNILKLNLIEICGFPYRNEGFQPSIKL